MKTSIMEHKQKKTLDPNSGAAKFFAALLALLVWQAAAEVIGNRLLLVGPVQVLTRLAVLAGEKDFWKTVWFTFSRITFGFLLAFVLALFLAALAARFPLAGTLLQPYMTAIQTVPVASFIVIAFLWLSGKKLSIFIAFLMVLPVLYANFRQGFAGADPMLKEMAGVFHMSLPGRIRCIYLPAAKPYVLSACRVALGLCWKAGVAAEVIGVCSGSVGGMLYDAKVYLEIRDLFAWTLVIVAVSMSFEKLFLAILRRFFRWMEEL